MPDPIANGGAERSGGVALLGDVVSSRTHPDRAGLQIRLAEALDAASADKRVTQRLRMTVGDEFQGVVASVPDAVRLALDLRLGLLPDVELRIGLGLGPFWVFDKTTTPIAQDGPAWWAARRAIEAAKDLSGRPASRHVRCWAAALGEDGREPTGGDGLPLGLNAYLVLQDFVLSTMRPRQLRLLAAALRGEQQRDVARREGITQSAVSQALAASGAHALTHALATLPTPHQPSADPPPESPHT